MASGHEQVVFCSDRESGLRAVIAVYSTALGPALGGTRFFPYATEEAAVTDALALSRAMAYKNSLAGLDLGGGKGVIIGDPRTDKTEALRVFAAADADGVSPAVAADRMAEERMRSVGRLATIRLPR